MAGAGDGWWRARASTRSVRKCLAYPNAGILQHVPATPATHEPFIPRLALLRRPQAQPELRQRDHARRLARRGHRVGQRKPPAARLVEQASQPVRITRARTSKRGWVKRVTGP